MSRLLFISALLIALVGNFLYRQVDNSIPGEKLYSIDRAIEQYAISFPISPLREVIAARVLTERFEELDNLNQINQDEGDEKRLIYQILEETFPKAKQKDWAPIKTLYVNSRNQGMTASHSAALVSAVNHVGTVSK